MVFLKVCNPSNTLNGSGQGSIMLTERPHMIYGSPGE